MHKDCLKNSIKIYIKIAPTCFGAVTPPSRSSLSVLARVTSASSTDNELREDGVSMLKHVGPILILFLRQSLCIRW